MTGGNYIAGFQDLSAKISAVDGYTQDGFIEILQFRHRKSFVEQFKAYRVV